MIYSQSCRYALRALIYLALKPERYLATVQEISEHEELPKQFLAKLLQSLARADLVASVKGPGGGFALRRYPDQISLYEVVEAIDGTAHLHGCVLGFLECSHGSRCGSCEHWDDLRTAIKGYLDATSVGDLSTCYRL